MRFTEFLPDLSLAFILWTVIGTILAFVLWLIIYVLFKATSKSIIPLHLEYIMAFFILIILMLFIKRTFLNNISLSNLVGLNHFVLLIIGAILVVVVVLFTYKYVEKILNGFDVRIKPVVWLFAILFILAVPFSLFKKDISNVKLTTDNRTHIVSQEKKPPNIIMVIMDTLTTHNMQIYGYDRPTTPFISEWAKDAIVFNRVYAPANWTTPSVMSLMTGQRVWTHKVWYRAESLPCKNYYENSLPTVLKDYGYANYAFVQNRSAHPESLGIKDAFLIKDKAYTFELSSSWWVDRLAEYFVHRPIVKEWIFEINPIAKRVNVHRPDEHTTLVPPENVYNRFLEFISQKQYSYSKIKSRQPFFAWLHIFPPHDPYLPPKPYIGIFGDVTRFDSRRKQEESGLLYMDYNAEQQIDVNILRTRYDEFISYSDRQFELFLSYLAESINISNTIIILTSDHGESFSHGYQGHDDPHLYESIIHVPLIIKFPGKSDGKLIDIPVELTDITPTILELAGIPVPGWMEGRSLLPLLEGMTIEPKPVFSMQLIENRSYGQPITNGTIAVWDGDYKLIYYLEDQKRLLFNLRSDPNETQNIFYEEHEISKRLMALINDSLSSANERIKRSREK